MVAVEIVTPLRENPDLALPPHARHTKKLPVI